IVAARLLSPQEGDVVLEPSAGTGSLAIWPRAIGANVICNELSERRNLILKYLGFETYGKDAEHLDDVLPFEIKPSGLVMKPPLSSSAGRTKKHDASYGAMHVETALRRLERDGRLVAITGTGMSPNASKFGEFWRRIIRNYNVRAAVQVGGKEFAKSGTNV